MIMNIYRNIDRKNIQFDFLVKEHVENGYEEEIKELGGRIFVVESAKKIGAFRYIKEQINIMKNNGPYVAVHSHVNTLSGLTLLAAKMSGIKKRISHSHTAKKIKKRNEKIGKILIKLTATDFVACGQDAGRELFDKKKFIVIPNGIDTKRFLPLSQEERKKLQQSLDVNTQKINICHIGRFVRVKNHDFILNIAEELKRKKFEYTIYLLGDGEEYNRIKNIAEEKKLEKIVFCGNVSNANEYLKTMDLLILPSFYEGLPTTIVEAQCAGIPCCISNNITKEVDFNLNLIKYLPLELEKWVEYIMSREYKLEKDALKIKKVMVDCKYDIDISSKIVTDLYLK